MAMKPKSLVKGTETLLEKGKKLLGIPTPPPPVDENTIASTNRQHGKDIMHTILGINLHKNKIHNEQDPDFVKKMESMQNSLAKALNDDTNTIFCDISAIDEDLQYAADAWSNAVKEGYYNKANWSMSALAKGVKELRTNVPNDKASIAAQVLAARKEKSSLYVQLIQHAESIDIANANIVAESVMLNKNTSELIPIQDLVNSVRADPSMQLTLSNIIECQLGKKSSADLSTEEVELRDKINNGVTLSRAITANHSVIDTNKVNLERAKNMLNAARASLTIEDLKNHEELLAAFNKNLDSIVKNTHDAMVYADHVRQKYESFEAELHAAWNTPEGRNVSGQAIDFINKTLTANTTNSDTVEIAASLQAAIEDADAENQANNERLNKLFQKNENKNLNYNT